MNIIPKRKLEFRTKIAKEEIQKRIQESPEYIGTVNNSSFKINRVINYRNSFLPQIKGDIQSHNNETKIEVTIQLQTFVLAFLMIWFIGVLLACFMTIASIPFSEFSKFELIPFGMLIVGILLLYIPFTIECRKSVNDLQRIFEAEIIQKY